MKQFFCFLLIFLFLMFNCSSVSFASTSDFSGTFNGSESGTSSSTGTGTFSGSGTGSLQNEGSIANYIVYCKVASSLSSITGDTSTSNYSFNNIGSQYYLNNVPSTPYVPSNPNRTTVYLCYYKPTGTVFYTGSNNYLADVYIPVTLSVGNGTSSFSFTESGSTTSKDSGTYSGTVTGTLAGAVENFRGLGGYPPAFPTSTGMSYSTQVSNYVTSLNIVSNGVTIPDGYTFAILSVTYNFTFSDITSIFKAGSYYVTFVSSGSGSANIPSFFNSKDTYAVSAHNNMYYNITAHNAFYNNTYGSYYYFDVPRDFNFSAFSPVVINYFVTEDVPPFNITYSNAASTIFVSDSNQVLDVLRNQNNSLNSAGGANSELNSQNELMSGALSDYQRDTDTSSQYSNIHDDLFVLDTSIFTQVASTITLFSSVVTGLFTAFGDLSVPLTLMLIVTFVSCIIGIIKITSDSS